MSECKHFYIFETYGARCESCDEYIDFDEIMGRVNNYDAIRDQLADALTEIAGLRAKHNDYEHPQDSIDRGNRISQLEIDKINLQSQLAELEKRNGRQAVLLSELWKKHPEDAPKDYQYD